MPTVWSSNQVGKGDAGKNADNRTLQQLEERFPWIKVQENIESSLF